MLSHKTTRWQRLHAANKDIDAMHAAVIRSSVGQNGGVQRQRQRQRLVGEPESAFGIPPQVRRPAGQPPGLLLQRSLVCEEL